MRGATPILALLLAASPASASGLGLDDLTRVEAAARDALGPGALSRAEPRRLILTCPGCEGQPMVDLRLGRQEDGTEGRVRSGQTTAARLEEQCRARQPDCRIQRRDVGPAVGWVSSWEAGRQAGRTLVLLRDGDALLVRVLAAEPEAARQSMDRLLRDVVPAIVGP